MYRFHFFWPRPSYIRTDKNSPYWISRQPEMKTPQQLEFRHLPDFRYLLSTGHRLSFHHRNIFQTSGIESGVPTDISDSFLTRVLRMGESPMLATIPSAASTAPSAPAQNQTWMTRWMPRRRYPTWKYSHGPVRHVFFHWKLNSNIRF